MKNFFVIFGLLGLLLGTKVQAQCSLNPTITPNVVMMCPNTSDTLRTGTYDSYQWFKNGQPIPGATLPYLVVNVFYDAPHWFSVRVTQDTCTATSQPVLVDGWGFLPPFVASSGRYFFDGNVGAAQVCLGDTIFYQLYGPALSIQWTKDGVDIPGANGQFFYVTSTEVTSVHYYHVSGAPVECPNFIQNLGVTLNVQFVECNVTGVEEGTLPKFSVYPNPMNSQATIAFNKEVTDAQWRVYDAFGRLVGERFGLYGSKFGFDAVSLSPGVYSIHLLANGKLLGVEKVVISR